MKKCLPLLALLAIALSAFGQGTINFNNLSLAPGTGAFAPVVAPIFGFDPASPYTKRGNPTSAWNGTEGPTPVPLGTQVYGGAPLHGTGYTVQLWAANSEDPDSALAAISTTTFRTETTAGLQGFFEPRAVNYVPGVPSDATSRAKFQLRVWDNEGGTITSWSEASEFDVLRDASTVFTVPYQLGGGMVQPPNLIGLESFQISLAGEAPEPSIMALFVLSAGFLLLVCGRKKSE